MITRSRLHCSALVGVLLALASADLQASVLRGRVLDAATGRPIAGATVVLQGTAHQAITSSSGTFFFDVLPGTYRLEVEHLAYAGRTDSVTVAAGDDVAVEILLAESAVRLEPIEVIARPQKLVSVGFFDRQARGIGIHITREEVEASRAQRVSDLLSRVPGLRRSMGSDGRSSISMRGVKSITQRCDTQYFLDGVQAEIGVVGVDAIPTRDVEGIEIYRGSSELPIQFDVGRASCGAILIWTRSGH